MSQATMTGVVEGTLGNSPPEVVPLIATAQGQLVAGDAPAGNLLAITPSDATTYSPPLRGLYVGTTGDVAVIAANDTVAVTLKNVPAGATLPVRCLKVMSTNTTASNIVGLR